jgi:hydroxyethylthiazole kinase
MRAPDTAPHHHDLSDIAALPGIAADILARLRARHPRVHCLTNAVAQHFTANVLLALGATPSMTMSAEEVVHFVRGSGALLINLGTLDEERRRVMVLAAAAAREASIPWILDPVKVDRSPLRADFARALLEKKPRALRLNAGEFAALAHAEADAAAIAHFAKARGLAVAMTAETDIVSDGAHGLRIGNGDPLMTRVTAMGCAESAVLAACLAVEPDAALAAASALLLFNVAGEIAAARARGPGSFSVEILDALYNLDAAALRQRAKVS